MKNCELWSQYKNYTEALTENSRKLAYVAGALCWFFKDDTGLFPVTILISLLFLVIFFLFDLMQYFLAAIIYRLWIRKQEQLFFEEIGTIEAQYDKPVWLDYPAFACWCLKLILLLLTFICLGWHIFDTSLSQQ